MMERLRQLLGSKKVPFSILNVVTETYDPYDYKGITGKLMIGVSTWDLTQVFNIDDEVPSIVGDAVRSKDAHEFLKLNMPVDEYGWDCLFQHTALEVCDDTFNGEGNRIYVKRFRTINCESSSYQTVFTIDVVLEVL